MTNLGWVIGSYLVVAMGIFGYLGLQAVRRRALQHRIDVSRPPR